MIPEKIALARGYVHKRAPYFAVGLYRLRPREVAGIETIAVDDGHTLYYDAGFIEECSIRDLAAVLVHELLHVMHRHAERARLAGVRSEQDVAAWNIAADLALWQTMRLGGWGHIEHQKPKAYRFPDGLTVEDYYARVKLLHDGKIRRRRWGSCATGVPANWEVAQHNAHAHELIRTAVAQAVAVHKKLGNSILPGIERLLDNTSGRPAVPWQRILESTLRTACYRPGLVDYARSRPSRRQASTPDVLRSALVQPMPAITVIVDTSASMSRDDLHAALAEVEGILECAGVSGDVRVLSCDDRVHTTSRARKRGQVKLVGGGGTSLGEGFMVARVIEPLSICIVLTDGWTLWPKARPVRGPIIVVLIGDGHADVKTIPRWAQVIDASGRRSRT